MKRIIHDPRPLTMDGAIMSHADRTALGLGINQHTPTAAQREAVRRSALVRMVPNYYRLGGPRS